MLKNYFKIAFRNLWRNKVFSFINIFGLAIGISCFGLILMYVQHELSYDQYHPNSDRVYRIAINIQIGNQPEMKFAPVMPPLAPVLAKDYPQVEQVVRILNTFGDEVLIQANPEKKFYEKGFSWADANVFQIFNFPLIIGESNEALQKPASVVISESIAYKYFSSTQVIGKNLRLNNENYTITGVMRDVPQNSHFRPDFIASMNTFKRDDEIFKNWHSTMVQTYLKLKPNQDAKKFEKQIAKVADSFVAEDLKKFSSTYTFFLQPLPSIHLQSNLRYELAQNGSITYIYVFLGVALLIILIACINFMNLATAQAAQRAKEVGVRKVIGAYQNQLIGQFLGESLLMSWLALILALGIIEILLPTFNHLAGRDLHFNDFFNLQFLSIFGLIFLVSGLLSGIYPALFLANFQPVMVLKGNFKSTGKGRFVRQGLVVFQFAISIILIIITLTINQQIDFMRNQNLGFVKDKIVVIPIKNGSDIAKKATILKQELKKESLVSEASVMSQGIGRIANNNLIQLKNDKSRQADFSLMFTDFDFLSTFKIQVTAGRAFSEKNQTDNGNRQAAIINEAGAKALGFVKPEEAIGQELWDGWGKIIGVVKDFHYSSLQKKIAPLAIYIEPNYANCIALKITSERPTQALQTIENKFKKILPELPFEYTFLDQDFDRQYKTEQQLGFLFSTFSTLAILIACLGLFGLTTYTVQQRTKEIGIRKVLGANILQIIFLISREFTGLILIAFVIATPLAYYSGQMWLQDFAYRIQINGLNFILAGFSAILIAFLTVIFQILKATAVNPVEVLKNE
jgi:putative ABC transport system permease protein